MNGYEIISKIFIKEEIKNNLNVYKYISIFPFMKEKSEEKYNILPFVKERGIYMHIFVVTVISKRNKENINQKQMTMTASEVRR